MTILSALFKFYDRAEKGLRDAYSSKYPELSIGGPSLGQRLQTIWDNDRAKEAFLRSLENPPEGLRTAKGMEGIFKCYPKVTEDLFAQETCKRLTLDWIGNAYITGIIDDLTLQSQSLGGIEDQHTESTINSLEPYRGRHGMGFYELIVAAVRHTEEKYNLIDTSAMAAAPSANITYDPSQITFDRDNGTHVKIALSDTFKDYLIATKLQSAITLDSNLILFRVNETTFSIGTGPGTPGIQIKTAQKIACNNITADVNKDNTRKDEAIRESNLTKILDTLNAFQPAAVDTEIHGVGSVSLGRKR